MAARTKGLVHLEGMQLDSPEHQQAQNAKAFAYVRPHDLDVERYSPGAGLDAEGRPRGIVAQLSRAIVVGPDRAAGTYSIRRPQTSGQCVPRPLIEAQIPAQQFKEHGFQRGRNAGGDTAPRPCFSGSRRWNLTPPEPLRVFPLKGDDPLLRGARWPPRRGCRFQRAML
jgi:hypothetical protein